MLWWIQCLQMRITHSLSLVSMLDDYAFQSERFTDSGSGYQDGHQKWPKYFWTHHFHLCGFFAFLHWPNTQTNVSYTLSLSLLVAWPLFIKTFALKIAYRCHTLRISFFCQDKCTVHINGAEWRYTLVQLITAFSEHIYGALFFLEWSAYLSDV